ncbi:MULTISPECIES: VOC family protein [Dyella]|uniref:VOC family protein n=2 Tax=Dyella TaxID=231454 RepID=A0A4R0YPT2_9GAMM|nr:MULTISPECIES: VOC family protein [Dyella]TBR37117.1 VOC family protein [Dyella terrae]TCI07793.1 VOC family protein [Dyella soli]
MAKITGLGGIFFKSRDPIALSKWYAEHLGLPAQEWGGAMFTEDESRPGKTLWSPFKADTAYFGAGPQTFMINFRVDDLDSVLINLRRAGVDVDDKSEASEYGKFGWFTDPEGHRVELWEPPASA